MRRQQVAVTRDRILGAASNLFQGYPIWNWSGLTIREVAKHAGLHERTVYRYFANERELRDAVMRRFEEEAGIDLEGLRLDGVAEVAARILAVASTFPIAPRAPRDPTVAAADGRQREALLHAVGPSTEGWSDVERRIVGSVLDVLWAPVSYERMVADWELAPKEAILGLVWAIGLVEAAVHDGKARPSRVSHADSTAY